MFNDSRNKVAINSKEGKIDISSTSFEYMDNNNISKDKAILRLKSILNKDFGMGIIIIITIAIILKATTISPNFIIFPPNNYL